MKISVESNLLKNLFKNVYFINGNAYAGKSTIVYELAKKYNGVFCKENYHDELFDLIDEVNQPNLSYIKNTKDWQKFVLRTPDEYNNWINGCNKEILELEIILLIKYVSLNKDKLVFVDTNIDINTLKEISTYNHILIMLAPIDISVSNFFNRLDYDKQFIYQELLKAKNPEFALKNYRKTLELINSQENYDMFNNSGFHVIKRDDNRSIMDTLSLVEKHFML